MTNNRLRVPTLATFLLATGAALVTSPLASQERHQLGSMNVAIYNLAGQVEVVPGEGAEVVVEMMRGGDDGSRLQVETSRIDGREAFRVIYPDDQIVYRPMGRSRTDLRVRRDGTFYGKGRGGDRVRISGRGSGLEAHADLRVRVPRGADVHLYLAVGDGRAQGVEADILFDTGSGDVEVSEVVGNVSVDTGSGSVRIAQVEGDVFTDTGSGAITLEDISGGNVSADTGSGSVQGANVTAHELMVDTGSGRIHFDALSATTVECDTGSGSVKLSLLTDVDHLLVDTGSGAVTLMVPAGFGAEVEVDVGSGGVNVDLPVQAGAVKKRDYFRGTVGDGGGRVLIDTGSGGVTIKPLG